MIDNLKLFLAESGQELRKVTWPGRKEILASSAVVLVVMVAAMLFTFVSDWLIGTGIEFVLK